ncbi:unnamed protein product [Mytilus edulis]|uniref:Uncharacterized protein n=1 Tax=Mytilus edulis TaxID=6550 RepID=A0A8S3U5B0_MYTED|nr:unnamed protein product [Mytilus edulis]
MKAVTTESVTTELVTTKTGEDTILEDNRSTMKTMTTTNSGNPMNNYYSTTKKRKKIKPAMISDLYVYIGAAAGVPILLLIGLIIVCNRKRSNQSYQTENQYEISMKTHNDNKDSDNDYDELNGDYITLKIKSSNNQSDKSMSQSTSEPVIKQTPNTYENYSLQI